MVQLPNHQLNKFNGSGEFMLPLSPNFLRILNSFTCELNIYQKLPNWWIPKKHVKTPFRVHLLYYSNCLRAQNNADPCPLVYVSYTYILGIVLLISVSLLLDKIILRHPVEWSKLLEITPSTSVFPPHESLHSTILGNLYIYILIYIYIYVYI